MNFDFSDEQKDFAAQARRILQDRCPPSRVRAILDGPEAFASDLWRELGELGYLGVGVEEAYGGLGLGYLEQCALAIEYGRALAPLPISSSLYLAAELLKAAGSEDQKQAWLPRLAAGDAIGTVAFVEPAGMRGTSRFEDGRIHGEKAAVPDGDVADLLICAASDGSAEGASPSLFLVDLKGPGVTRTPVQVIDPTRSHAYIALHHAPAERLGAPGDAVRLLGDALDRAAVLLAFEQVGGAERVIETARDYACERIAFGRPIGSFQAIKHMLADMYVSAALARSIAYYGAWALSTGSPELPLAAAMARVSATQAFQQCARNAIQVHGGNGFTWEFDCHLYYRRSSLLALTLGSMATWEGRLVDRLAASHGR